MSSTRSKKKRLLIKRIEHGSNYEAFIVWVMLAYLRIFKTIKSLIPRPINAYYIGDRRRNWLEKLEDKLGLERPNRSRDLRINIMVIVATLELLVITIVTATAHIEALLIIPVVCFYLAGMLAYRQHRLGNMAV
jgi:hypothetical protein